MKPSSPTVIIRNNTSDTIPVELFKNPPSPNSLINATVLSTWNVCSLLFTNLTTVTVQARLQNVSTFTTFSATIQESSVQGVVDALNTLGIGFFDSEITGGQQMITARTNRYTYGSLVVNDDGAHVTVQFQYTFNFNVSDPGYAFTVVKVGSGTIFSEFDTPAGSGTGVVNTRGATVRFGASFSLVHTGTITLSKNGCEISQASFNSNSASLSTVYDRSDDQYDVVIDVNS